MKTPDKKTKAPSESEKKSAVHTPTPPQVVYPLEKPDSKKNQANTTSTSKSKKD